MQEVVSQYMGAEEAGDTTMLRDFDLENLEKDHQGWVECFFAFLKIKFAMMFSRDPKKFLIRLDFYLRKSTRVSQ